MEESLIQEKSALVEAKELSELHIMELRQEIKTLTERTMEREMELERSEMCWLIVAYLFVYFYFSI